MSDMNAFAEALIKDRKSEFERLQAKHDRLRAALERLTSACERSHKTIYIGTTHDRYDMAYERGGEDPVKLARAALAEQEKI
jgi:hypothetical protein